MFSVYQLFSGSDIVIGRVFMCVCVCVYVHLCVQTITFVCLI